VLFYRRIRYGYPFRRIPLTQGKFAIVDPEDYERLNKYKWYAIKGKSTFYAGRHSKIGINKKRLYIKMHRQIITHPRFMVVDHINHNGLDNRKANLRAATFAQNVWNCRRRKGCSGYKGIWFAKDKAKFRAAIWHNKKREYLGYFDSPRQAAQAYDRAAKKYHGDFAALNFNK